MLISILFAVLMSSFIAFGSTESAPANTTDTTASMQQPKSYKAEEVGEEGKYSQILKN